MSFYRFLAVPLTGDDWIVIDGMHLLMKLQEATNALPGGNAMQHTGAADDPWELRTVDDWLGCVKSGTGFRGAAQRAPVHFNFGGRLIRGDQKYYFGDAGPVWRAGEAPHVGFTFSRSTDTVPSEAALDRWNKVQTNPDPSYQKFAQRVVNPEMVFKDEGQFNYADGPWQNTWAEVGFNSRFTGVMRDIMARRPIARGGTGGKFDKHYSRLQHMLPCLVAAMFVAEPCRNLRAWTINLMLLDLADSGRTVLMHQHAVTWNNILWHPQALEVSRARPETKDNPVLGMTPLEGPQGDDRTLAPVLTIGKLHNVGGMMPASPTGGGKYSKGAPQPKSHDYIHLKEIEVLLTWLSVQFPRSIRMRAGSFTEAECVKPSAVKNPAHVGGPAGATLTEIGNAIVRRSLSIAAM